MNRMIFFSMIICSTSLCGNHSIYELYADSLATHITLPENEEELAKAAGSAKDQASAPDQQKSQEKEQVTPVVPTQARAAENTPQPASSPQPSPSANVSKETPAAKPAEKEVAAEISKTKVYLEPAINELLSQSAQGFDVKAKRAQVVSLVEKAAKYMAEHDLAESFHALTHSDDFHWGELYTFVYTNDGTCFASGEVAENVWKNMWDLKDQYNTFIVQEMIKAAKPGSGWLTYNWQNAIKVTYVKQVIRDDVVYVVGSGYYPHSKEDQVVGLVKGAVGLFNDLVIKKKYPVEEAFSSYTYPMGRFVVGDLYIYVLDFDGTIFAQGDRPGLIGTNAWNYADSRGKKMNQEIISKLKVSGGQGVWVDYYSKGVPKLAYAEKVVDRAGKEYFIASGYYPTVTRDKAVEVVRKAYEYMKRQGKSRAVEAFISRKDNMFHVGDLTITVLSPKGDIIADGKTPDYIGANVWQAKDEDNHLYIQELISKALEGGGWITFKVHGSFESAYSESIQLGLEKYIISAGLYPVSKEETTLLMLRSAVSYLKMNEPLVAFRGFIDQHGSFVRGDLYITVYDDAGICIATGGNSELTWTNMMDAKDQNGKPYVRLLINGVKRGPAKLTYNLFGGTRVDFAEQVERQGKTYVVVCGYYL